MDTVRMGLPKPERRAAFLVGCLTGAGGAVLAVVILLDRGGASWAQTILGLTLWAGLAEAVAVPSLVYASAQSVLDDEGVTTVHYRRRRIRWQEVAEISIRSTATGHGTLNRVELLRRDGSKSLTLVAPREQGGNNPEFTSQVELIRRYFSLARATPPNPV